MTDITIAGLGITNVDQVTRETERALRACNEVLFVDTGIATEAWLRTLCPRVTDLYAESYREGAPRVNAYHHMAASTLEAALDHAPVVFAMQGHPIVYAYAPFLIRDTAALLGLEVEVLPGISSLDCLLADLMVDPGVQGMQLYEATDLLLRKRPLQPDVPALVWQVGTVETRLHTDRPSRPERFVRLRDHLLRSYPPQHPVTAYFAAPFPMMPPSAITFALQDLCDQAPLLHKGVTLYLPPATVRPVEDLELQGLVDDPAHLAKLTR